MNVLRRMRGVAVTAALWGTAFALASGVISVVLRVLGIMRPRMPWAMFGELLVKMAAFWGVFGAGVGVLFALTIMLTQRKRRVDSLPPIRFTLLGLVVGMAIPLVLGSALILVDRPPLRLIVPAIATLACICGAIGAAIAAATIRLARRGNDSPSIIA